MNTFSAFMVRTSSPLFSLFLISLPLVASGYFYVARPSSSSSQGYRQVAAAPFRSPYYSNRSPAAPNNPYYRHPTTYGSYGGGGYAPPPRPAAAFYNANQGKIARVELVPGGDSGVNGTLYMKQRHPGEAVLITGKIYGLSEGKHGFHIHMKGELGNNCKDAGGHFNPFMKSHGDPFSLDRHVGDLGNILTFHAGLSTEVFIFDKLITLEEGKDNGILGRAVVVHAGTDDLGAGGDEESLKTGNAGARVACGVIKPISL